MLLTVDLARLDVRPGQLVLDAGCGEGRHCFGCLERGARVVGLDLDFESLRLPARRLRKRAGELKVQAEKLSSKGLLATQLLKKAKQAASFSGFVMVVANEIGVCTFKSILASGDMTRREKNDAKRAVALTSNVVPNLVHQRPDLGVVVVL